MTLNSTRNAVLRYLNATKDLTVTAEVAHLQAVMAMDCGIASCDHCGFWVLEESLSGNQLCSICTDAQLDKEEANRP